LTLASGGHALHVTHAPAIAAAIEAAWTMAEREGAAWSNSDVDAAGEDDEAAGAASA
jgi:hypothetical protein